MFFAVDEHWRWSYSILLAFFNAAQRFSELNAFSKWSSLFLVSDEMTMVGRTTITKAEQRRHRHWKLMERLEDFEIINLRNESNNSPLKLFAILWAAVAAFSWHKKQRLLKIDKVNYLIVKWKLTDFKTKLSGKLPSSLTSTKNLLLSSGFGSNLAPLLQNGPAPLIIISLSETLIFLGLKRKAFKIFKEEKFTL